MNSSSRKVRLLGGLLMVLGLGLCGGMGWLIVGLTEVMASGDSRRWTGGPMFTEATMRLLFSVLYFGMAALVAGLGQALSGRRQRVLLLPPLVAGLWLVSSLLQLLSTPSSM